jgi:hypothetical protein
MRRFGWFGATALVVLVLGYAAPAIGWNDTGHMVAALIAYDELPAEERAAVGVLLHKHPRFTADFMPNLPRGLRRAAAEQDRWYFAFAATWPDVARRFDNVGAAHERDVLIRRYHRGSWHYINLPTYLRPADAQLLRKPTPAITGSFWQSDADLNVVQALQRVTHTLCSANAADDERALALSWLLHLLADLHQPLHTTALYAADRLPNGDRGGNDIAIRGGGNLHALWDGALGNDRRWRRIETLAAQDRVALDWAAVIDFAAWAEQGRELADRVVYSQAIRHAVRAGTLVDVDSTYRIAMDETAQSQVGLAGARTARVVTHLFDADAGQRCR